MSKIDKTEDAQQLAEINKSTGEVVYLDILKEIPDPKFPLGKAGTNTYNERCKALLKAGLLTVNTKDFVEMLAVADDLMEKSINNGGKNMRVAAEMKRSALIKLDKIDADQIVVTPGQGKGAHSRFGFAKRARQREHG